MRSPKPSRDWAPISTRPRPASKPPPCLRRGGRPRDAAADEHRAAQLLSRCEGATTPVVKTITARARLTPGELDAAVQAAAGRSNKQIAADSHISVRTVESHLQRVYEKLGISSRRELAEALRDQPGI